MAVVPFVCHWKGNHVKVTQTLDGKKIHNNGNYNVIIGDVCEKCGNPHILNIKGKWECKENELHSRLNNLDKIVQLGFYYRKSSMFLQEDGDVLNEHIWGLKKDPVYAKPLAQAMYLAIKEKFRFLLNVDTIVPIPNHPDDYFKDAKAVALGLELCEQYRLDNNDNTITNALLKTKNTSLRFMSDADKEEAVGSLYIPNPGTSVSNKTILLVDDVLTKGFQKGKCATILKESGAKKIWGCVAGRTT